VAWRGHARAKAITGDWTACELRRLAAASRHANQSRRLLSLATVLDGMNRPEAAGIRVMFFRDSRSLAMCHPARSARVGRARHW
jgi:hypothetical protein